MRRVVVTGLGAVTPLGVGVRNSWKRLLAGETGIVSTRSKGPDFQRIPSQVAGLVPFGTKETGGWQAEDWLTKRDERNMALFAQFAMAAAQEAVEDAKLDTLSEQEREKVGVNVGSGIGSLEDVTKTTLDFASGGYRKVSPLFVPRLLINLAAGHITMKHGFHGPSLSPSTACTTGSHAIGDAYSLIRHGNPLTPVVLAGASESCIVPISLAGFARARSLSTAHNDDPNAASRPFDKARDGFVVSEGAAILVLEELEHAKARGAKIYAELVGYGLSSDAHHITAPHPKGLGAYLSMKRALESAGLSPADVDYVNAHATGTPLGDAAENRAIRDLLVVDGGKSPANVNVSSVKGAVGHMLGAAGALEGVFTVLSLKDGVLPPTVNLDEPGDVASQPKSLVEENRWDLNYVPKLKQKKAIEVAVSNSFGFGGTCASLCFKKFDE